MEVDWTLEGFICMPSAAIWITVESSSLIFSVPYRTR